MGMELKMDLLPTIDILEDKITTSEPSKVHHIVNTKTMKGIIDEINSVKQACFCILATEKNIHKIYDKDYGLETFDLIGKNYSYIASELKRRIIEALKYDDRVKDVKGFIISKIDKDSIHLSFKVDTIYGQIDIEKTVKIIEGE